MAPKKSRDSLEIELKQAASKLSIRRYTKVKYNKIVEKISYKSADELKESLKKLFFLSDFDAVEFVLEKQTVDHEISSIA